MHTHIEEEMVYYDRHRKEDNPYNRPCRSTLYKEREMSTEKELPEEERLGYLYKEKTLTETILGMVQTENH